MYTGNRGDAAARSATGSRRNGFGPTRLFPFPSRLKTKVSRTAIPATTSTKQPSYFYNKAHLDTSYYYYYYYWTAHLNSRGCCMVHALLTKLADSVAADTSDVLMSPTATSLQNSRTNDSNIGMPLSRLPIHHRPERPASPIDDPPSRRARASRRHAALGRISSFTHRVAKILAHFGITIRLPRWIWFSLVSAFLIVWYFWEVHIEIAFYPKGWIESDIKKLEPLSGCFNAGRISPMYNLTAARGPKMHEVQAGVPLRLGMDCYDFAGTIRDPPGHRVKRKPVIYHTYWRADLAPFGERQAWLIRSFFATQDLTSASMVLWSNGDLNANPWIAAFTRTYSGSFETRIVDVEFLARDTALAKSDRLHTNDPKAWVDGDVIRLLVIWEYGGVWVDMDSLLTRDLGPLLDHEFVTQWDCYDKIYRPLNGALMHFHQHSPYLCEFFHIMAESTAPRPGTTDWGSTLYLKLWRRLVNAGIPAFKILPFCFSDGRSCRMDNRLPDPFVLDADTRAWGARREGLGEGGRLDKALGNVFAIHLHNQWEKDFPSRGWVERLLLSRYRKRLSGKKGRDGDTVTEREVESSTTVETPDT
ncbi:hypothetical protein FRB96_008090 [Tulasnella sp. 330]|nr:hypothetical protein FRB96_008090 [Tulasnella sp. 330]